MSNDRYVYKCYNMLRNSNFLEQKFNWVREVKTVLCKFGFAYIWNNQGTSNERAFLNCLPKD